MNVFIEIDISVWDDLREHLLVRDPRREQAAFLFAQESTKEKEYRLAVTGTRLIASHELAFHSSFHLELKEETWSSVIREAHQKHASLIEAHSHLGDDPAEFSASDLYGLRSTAPHVAWRLKGRSFAAIVLTRHGLDALVWLPSENDPRALSALLLGSQRVTATDRSRRHWHDIRSDSLRPQHRALWQ